MSTSKIAVWVGLDDHQKNTQVCVVNGQGEVLCNRSVPSEIGPIAQAIEHHGLAKVVAIEACTGSAQLAHELIEQAGLAAKLTHPGSVNRMRHNPNKSDLSDARMLAELARIGWCVTRSDGGGSSNHCVRAARRPAWRSRRWPIAGCAGCTTR